MFREALKLGRHAGLVYGLLWEAAWHDDRPGGDGKPKFGGTTGLSHVAIADQCGIGRTNVIKAIDQLLDDGLIACMWLEPTGKGSWKRRYRVLRSDQVGAQRAAIAVMGQKPSERAAAIRERKETPWVMERLGDPMGGEVDVEPVEEAPAPAWAGSVVALAGDEEAFRQSIQDRWGKEYADDLESRIDGVCR